MAPGDWVSAAPRQLWWCSLEHNPWIAESNGVPPVSRLALFWPQYVGGRLGSGATFSPIAFW